MTLQTYYIDWLKNGDAYKRKTDQTNADKIVRKLRKHFKVPTHFGEKGAIYNFRANKGAANLHTNRIYLSRNEISLGVINHEIAHLVGAQRYGSKGHDKQFRRALRIVNNYVKKKHFFDNEINWEGEHDKNKQVDFPTFVYNWCNNPTFEGVLK